MSHLEIPKLLPYPDGSNETDTLINGLHYNKTALDFFNYTLWGNHTLSNGSKCFLAFDKFQPVFLSNGTVLNGTSCYDPYYHIHQRGALGIVFGTLFGLSLVPTLVNLRNHGRLFVPQQKRFRAVGRRWQWYWMIFVGACGLISGLMSIDVDRAFIQSTPIVLTNFFFFLMTPSILAALWEGVRHWGSWQERQLYDQDPFAYPQEGKRSKEEFYMPLIFYLFGFLNFFMVIPRSWTKIEHQRDLVQQVEDAKPVAIDARFKVGAIFAFLAWCVICYSLRHTHHYYKPARRGLAQKFVAFFRYTPVRFMFVLPIALVVIGYDVAIAFDWSISPLKFDVNSGWVYGLGFAPTLLILAILNVSGFLSENEDKVLLAQRRERGRETNADLGIVKKPGWWSKRHGDFGPDTPELRLKALASEVGGGPATQRNIERGLELGTMPVHHSEHVRPPTGQAFTDDPEGYRDTFDVESLSTRRQSTLSETHSTGNTSQSSTLNNVPPTRVRSMLDV